MAFIGFWLTFFLVIPRMEWNNLLPVFSIGIKPILKGSLIIQGLTYAEMAVFLMIMPFLNQRKHLTKIMVSGGIVAGFSLLVIFLSSILVLGAHVAGISIFPPLIWPMSSISLTSLLDLKHYLLQLIFLHSLQK